MRFPLPHPDHEFQPIARGFLYAWLAFYLLYMFHAFRAVEFTIIYPVELILHEAGHLLFSYLGQTMGLWGGTIFQLLVPAILAISFAWRGQTTGVVFCTFFFFESLLGISIYMADAQEMDLPLITGGEPSEAGVPHDWWNILTQLGLLQYDKRLAAMVKAIGWLGMIATVAWMYYMSRKLGTQEILPKAHSAR